MGRATNGGSWASTLVESQDLKNALAVAESALRRYPGSALEDEFLYTAGYARFALGESDAAFEILERVASAEFPKAGGGVGASENRKHAIYLQGQIHHARGEPRTESTKAAALTGSVWQIPTRSKGSKKSWWSSVNG